MPKTLIKQKAIDPEKLKLESAYAQQLITAGVNTELAKAAAQILAHHAYPLYDSELAVLKAAWRQALKNCPQCEGTKQVIAPCQYTNGFRRYPCPTCCKPERTSLSIRLPF